MTLGRGHLVDGRYRVLERIGGGASSVVYLAEEPKSGGRRVALKVLRGCDAPESTLGSELAKLQEIGQTNLARVLGHGRLPEGGDAYVAYEWIEGADLLEAARLVPVTDLRGLLIQLCRGLQSLHDRGVIHGSLKPSNLRVARAPDGGAAGLHLKILDYGLGRLIARANEEQGGTLIYAAPELLQRSEVDGRADLYALGIVLYQVLTGTLPFDTSNPAAILRGHLEEMPRPIDPERTGTPPDLVEVTSRLLMKNPEDRFTAAELEQILARGAERQSLPPKAGSASDLRAPALVGRDVEVAALESFLDGHLSQARGPGLVLTIGEGGIGKSRLLQEMAAMARRRDLPVRVGTCHETGGAPFGAFLDLLEWTVAISEERGLCCANEEHGPVSSLVERYGPEVVKVMPRALRGTVDPSPELQPRYERLRLIDAIGTFLLEVSRAQSFVLLLENLHWTDDASADLLEYLLRNRARGRIALAAAARPGENRDQWLKESLEREGGPDSILRINLTRLTQKQIAELARSALGLHAPPEDLAGHLLRETAGNPFFSFEMLRDLVEEGLLSRRDGEWAWDMAALRRRPRSAGIAQALERRLTRVGQNERATLEALALLDRAVDSELLSVVAAAAAEDGSDADCPQSVALERLMERGLILQEAGEPSCRYRIAHDATREILERTMGGDVRSRVHRAAAEALEARHGVDSEEQIERIAYHFIQAADDERSARYCVRAAQKARRLYANEEASYFYLQALKYYTEPDDPVRWDALGSLGEVYLMQGKVSHARTRYEEMRKLAVGASNIDRTITAHLGIAEVERKIANYSAQKAHSRAAFKLASRTQNTVAKADALQILGLAHYNLGFFDKAIRCYSVALNLLRQSRDVRITSNVLNRLGLAYLSRGDLGRARALFGEALQLAERHDLRIHSAVLNNLGCLAEIEGSYQEAIESYRHAEAIATARGDRYTHTLAILNQASVFLKLNSLDRVDSRLRKALRMAVEIGERQFQGHIAVYLAQWNRINKSYADAAEYLNDAESTAKAIKHCEIQLFAKLERARLALDTGEVAVALDMATALLDEADSGGVSEVAIYAAVIASESHRRLGAGETAMQTLHRCWSILSRTPYPDAEWQAHMIAGSTLDARGANEEADSHYRAGLAIIERMATRLTAPFQEQYLREPQRLALRVRAARALQRGGIATSEPLLQSLSVGSLRDVAALGPTLLKVSSEQEVVERSAKLAAEVCGGACVVFLGATPVARYASSKTAIVASDLESRIAPEVIAGNHRSICDTNAQWALEARRVGVHSMAAVAIPGASGARGVLYIGSSDPGAIGMMQVELVNLIASQMALALASVEDGSQGQARTLASNGGVVRFGRLRTRNREMQVLCHRLRALASSDAAVLLEGESGTGKEVVARALHAGSARANGPFITMDCGAIPESLAEAELFGYTRGAFTGAVGEHDGMVRSAHGGTLFLDEIGNLPNAVQAKLLRLLQTGEVRPLGGKRTVRSDFRVLAATNENLHALVRQGRFRADLYYRISAVNVCLLPLRKRPEDLGLLVDDLVEELCSQEVIVSHGVMDALRSYDWPGNIRELRNVLEAAIALGNGQKITRSLLPPGVLEGSAFVEKRPQHGSDVSLVKAALKESRGDKSAAARNLGWSRMKVYRVLRRAGLPLNLGSEPT